MAWWNMMVITFGIQAKCERLAAMTHPSTKQDAGTKWQAVAELERVCLKK